MLNYRTGLLQNSAKMVLLFHLIDESVKRKDKMLIFRYILFMVFILLDTFYYGAGGDVTLYFMVIVNH